MHSFLVVFGIPGIPCESARNLSLAGGCAWNSPRTPHADPLIRAPFATTDLPTKGCGGAREISCYKDVQIRYICTKLISLWHVRNKSRPAEWTSVALHAQSRCHHYGISLQARRHADRTGPTGLSTEAPSRITRRDGSMLALFSCPFSARQKRYKRPVGPSEAGTITAG